MTAPTRADAQALDTEDPLAPFRDRFVIHDPEIIYMDGNSLGRLPIETQDRIRSMVAGEWGGQLVRGWDEWLDLPTRAGVSVAALIGALAEEVVVSDSTTVNLFKLASAALDARPGRNVIVTEADNFPTDLYVLQGIARNRGLELRLLDVRPGERADARLVSQVLDEDVALVSLSHVHYRTAALADMPGVTAAVQDAGALMLWDLCHAVGAVPIDLGAARADLAVGCTYKYLNAGPGAPAVLYVRRDLIEELTQPVWGWFGQTDQFAMGPEYHPLPDIRRFLTGTPPIVALAGVEIGARLISEAGIGRLREKSLRLTDLILALHEDWLAPMGFDIGTPRSPDERGAHIALRHAAASDLCRKLIEKGNVIPDFREPDVIRYAPAPIYASFVEVWDAMEKLRELAQIA